MGILCKPIFETVLHTQADALSTMQYWLVKQEPDVYPWSRLLTDGSVDWDGVRNFQARNNLANMRSGDRVFFYHSVKERQVVGIMRVAREAFPDPTSEDPRWLAVTFAPEETLPRPVTLATIKSCPQLQQIPLIRQSRLSVMPLTADEFETILTFAR